MARTMQITCDSWQTIELREMILQAGLNILYDGKLDPRSNIHLFRIVCESKNFKEHSKKFSNIIKEFNSKIKQAKEDGKNYGSIL